MRTSEKRQHFFDTIPAYKRDAILDNIRDGDFRWVDGFMQRITDSISLQYVITLLCDELVSLTNENEDEDEL